MITYVASFARIVIDFNHGMAEIVPLIENPCGEKPCLASQQMLALLYI
jgi:hypothetical protein